MNWALSSLHREFLELTLNSLFEKRFSNANMHPSFTKKTFCAGRGGGGGGLNYTFFILKQYVIY